MKQQLLNAANMCDAKAGMDKSWLAVAQVFRGLAEWVEQQEDERLAAESVIKYIRDDIKKLLRIR